MSNIPLTPTVFLERLLSTPTYDLDKVSNFLSGLTCARSSSYLTADKIAIAKEVLVDFDKVQELKRVQDLTGSQVARTFRSGAFAQTIISNNVGPGGYL